MRRMLILIISLSIVCSAFAQKKHYIGKKYTCDYSTKNGLMDGAYTSYYLNGKKKCEGTFINNQHVGKWSVWDSLGNLKMTRIYKNDFDYERSFPEFPKDGPYKLLSKMNYELKYNNEGYIEPFLIRERMVMLSKRLWRDAYISDNKDLFPLKTYIDTALMALKNKQVTAYKDEDFTEADTIINIEQKLKNSKIIGMRIKEDWFFDSDRLISETRIIGIAPIIQNGKDTTALTWFYYPTLQKHAAKIILNKNIKPFSLKSIDDVFFFRYFSSLLYKEENVYDRPIEKYALAIAAERLSIQMDMLNNEAEIWLYISK